jgi:MoxR-like ATPase
MRQTSDNETEGCDVSSGMDMAKRIAETVRDNVESVVVLEDRAVVDYLLVALICRGHVLLNDVPGVGKTLLCRTFARSLDLDFKRIQFTPDLLPSDVVGINFYNQRESEFEFRPGPVFTNVVLADEINRATPRTQSSLLECMQEATVTVDGVTRQMEKPFLVIATQNPVEMEGTFPLPEAQMDRFLMCLGLGYPSSDREREMVLRFLDADPLSQVRPVASRDDIETLERASAEVSFSSPVMDYALALSRVTRSLDGVRLGVSPRGSLFLCRCARALALVRGRSYVIPDDVQELAVPVLAHRIVPDVSSSLFESGEASIVRQALARIPVPVGEARPFEETSPRERSPGKQAATRRTAGEEARG